MAGVVAIGCSHLSKSFELVDTGSTWRFLLPRNWNQSFAALTDVTIDVPKGQIVGILGRNGAGKSTLLRTIGGIYAPDSGQIAIAGTVAGLYELGASYNRELTGRQYARRLFSLTGVNADRMAALIDDAHEFSELAERFEDPIFTYSAGMAARLFFAVATADPHDVYLIDEILAVGDHHFQTKCWRRIRERLSRGASGLLVTHDWSAVMRLCREAYILDQGRISYSGPSDIAVRRYLEGDSPAGFNSETAAFDDKLPTRVTWQQGSACELRLPVIIKRARAVSVRVSVEFMRVGHGWEVVLLSRDATQIGDTPGFYEVEISVARLPLVPGTYTLAASLITEAADQEREIHDAVGWLYGNGIEIEVTGDADDIGLDLSTDWELTPCQAVS
jgi:lipopolysaccharide transport system ATP-binding protein